MFSRYFLTFCVVILTITLAIASAQQETEVDHDESSLEIAERSKIGKKVEKILKKVFKHINDHCIKKAIEKCKKHWYNPAKVISCATDLFSLEGALCLVGA